jgi:hypothetical protein
VPEPVPDVVTSTFGLNVPYATCHALTSGRSRVLPVSDTVVPPVDGLAAADGEVAGNADEPDPAELLQATSRVSGSAAAAMRTRRMLLATEGS